MSKLKDTLKRAYTYVVKGVPNRVVNVHTAQIKKGSLLEGKKILITGGSRGIGLAIAKRALEEGALVTITGRNIEQLEKVKEELGDSKQLFVIQHDITDYDSDALVVQKAREKMLGVDILVNNAGVSVHEINYSNCTQEQWDYQMNTNLKGTYFMTQAFLHYYEAVQKRQGKIINMVSERGLYGDDVPYGLAKRALISYTEGLAVRLIQKGIRVNAIAPGVTATDMTGYSSDGNLYRPYAKGRRVFLAEEIAEVAVFLMSDASNCISGQVIACNEANHLK